MKRSTLVLVALGMGAFAGCSVKSSGLNGGQGGAASTGGATATGGARSGGASGQATGGAPGNDAATARSDARGPDGLLGDDGIGGAGSGGTPGQDAPSVLEDTAGAGDSGGAAGVDGAPATGGGPGGGGGPGTGGNAGAGGQMGLDGSAGRDGASDAVDAPSREAGSDLPLDYALDRDDGDVGRPDGPGDARDARGTRDVRDTGTGISIDGGPTLYPVWADEFNGLANTGVDSGNWNYVTWPPGQVNNEKQQYTSSLSNVFHDGEGHLVLRALYSSMAANPYTSGRIDTKNKVTFGPGHRVEVRARLPAGAGSFPAIIMMGSSGTWPNCGQLSLMEQFGQEKDGFYSAVTAGSGAGSGSTDRTAYTFAPGTSASTDFHVYSLDWYTDRVVFQVDGNQILASSYGASSPLATIAEYIILDVALGGDMGGAIDNTAFPMDMVLDFIRVYEF